MSNNSPERVEALGLRGASTLLNVWGDLASHALESNIYLEPGFALAAAKHLGATNGPKFLIVRGDPATGEAGRLTGLFAVETLGRYQVTLRSWLPRQAALGTPLLDRNEGEEAFAQTRTWLAKNYPALCGITFRYLASDGPVATLVRDHARHNGLPLQEFSIGERAELAHGSDIDAMLGQNMSRKHRKYLDRVRRRLEELGSVTYSSARSPDDIRKAQYAFLELEARGWKGRRQTALTSSADEHAFAIDMLEEVTTGGKCHIDTLSIDGKPIAMGIVLMTGEEAFIWKIAYDEEYASYSPGLQFMVEFSRRQSLDDTIKNTDSCAIPDHPMFSNIWTDRLALTDLSIAVTPERAVQFHLAMQMDGLRRNAREKAKQVFYAVSGRQRR
ncbi:MAG: GNAT family N-acetyltransferase [Hyphomicrobiales bacterium]|nr:GNAT family N-acetyltransferase [Hyphomicrobiales bacterium]